MQRKLDVCLYDVKKFAEIILLWTAERSFEQYSADALLKAAVEREFTLLGEALVRVRQYFPDSFDRIQNALKIVRFRNRLVHLYDLMNDPEVWRVIQDELPIMMISQVDDMLLETQR